MNPSEGGEIVRFRHFIITGLLASTALFFPVDAFAEKNQPSPRQDISEKAAIEVPQREAKKIPKISQKPEKATTVEVQKDIPDRKPTKKENTRNTAIPLMDGAEKPIKQKVPNKDGVKTRNNQENKLAKAQAIKSKKTSPNTQEETPAEKSLHNDSTGEQQSRKRMADRLEKKETTVVSISNPTKKPVSEPASLQIKPVKPKAQEKQPSKRKKYSGDIIVFSSPLHPKPAGASKDRAIQGQSGTFSDKWFDWSKYTHLKLTLPFISREKILVNQWVNAPPSQPPKKALFF